ncbi:hypothetical protein PHYBLDRAFT_175875 [Phycomyces blakesleeanus NRRL 1555(-)]|uniref:Uncharacterized protein n=1 Tax=Phycomyces blakesleeanus (strain ATCC 8743b / DSM 1359 / FGSC 10004 / NBRC 33097 / NRRL 1555) TaxID=763407 RepID=A0A162T2C5_PHYB8|nr:hypothetical protein PHYBLDRAFT_175875 [Phycomyces blakesleeanus NRRL 1555(-)]OAD65702.1 hypothetical protein PHYBLDRAFT_175875 [Phycomyces blakesleeanus NRRL 1555(-)]|eukprot:XP_018283742.1 hypothetical protein PHYBLDRAFT_175875 [Phycomyces blakesleeanus NRRL 1555(-)]
MGYYLTDGIYPTYGAFVKSLNDPRTPKEKNFAKAQEGSLDHPGCGIETHFMTACIILHNMIVEEKRKSMEMGHADDGQRIADERQCIDIDPVSTLAPVASGFGECPFPEGSFARYLQRHLEIRNRDQHF